MGSGSDNNSDVANQLAQAVGTGLAKLANPPVHLLTGAGGGLMTLVSRAFAETPRRQGLVIGVIPGEVYPYLEDHQPPTAPHLTYRTKGEHYPNPWVEIPIYTHLPVSGTEGKHLRSRNHINILTASAVIVLPGGPGTRAEKELAEMYGKWYRELRESDNVARAVERTMLDLQRYLNTLHHISTLPASSPDSSESAGNVKTN